MATRTASTPTTLPEQLSLLSPSDLPVQFRLDRRTRERGLAHIAQIRRQLAVNAAHRTPTSSSSQQQAA